MSSRALICTFVLTVVVSGVAQPAPGQPASTFRATSELVQVTTIVHDGHGRHISGLKKDQFVVLEDGVAQPIAHFEEVASVELRPTRVQPQPGTYTNAIAAEQQSPRLTVVLLDLVNSSPPKQEHSRKGLIKFVASLGDTHEPIMVVVMTNGGLKVIHDFTTDPEVLTSALKKVKSAPDRRDIGTADLMAMLQAQQDELLGMPGAGQEIIMISWLMNLTIDRQQISTVDRTELTLACLRQLTQALSGVPGRKSLIWSTEGVAYVEPSFEVANQRGGRASTINFSGRAGLATTTALNTLFERTWREMSSAGISVYPIDLAEIDNPAWTAPRSAESMSQVYRSNGGMLKAMAMDGFTSNTGGRYCLLQEHMENCFRDAVDDSSRYYQLSYYPSAKGKPGWRKLHVDVNVPGAHVRSRSGYTARERDEDVKFRKSMIAEALDSPLEYTAIPLSVRWQPGDGKQDQRAFSVTIPPETFSLDGDARNHFRLTVVAATKDSAGSFGTGVEQILEGNPGPESLAKIRSAGIVYRGRVTVPPGAETVRIAVRDEISGRIGTVTAKVDR